MMRLLVLLFAVVLRTAVSQTTYQYKVQFGIDRLEASAAQRLASFDDAFKSSFQTVLKAGFADGVATFVNLQKLYYVALVNSLTSTNLEVEFEVVSSEAAKPPFSLGGFITSMETELGIMAKTSSVMDDALAAEEGEDEEVPAVVMPDRPLSRKLAHAFSIVGLVFIGLLLTAGYLVDLKTAGKASRVEAQS